MFLTFATFAVFTSMATWAQKVAATPRTDTRAEWQESGKWTQERAEAARAQLAPREEKEEEEDTEGRGRRPAEEYRYTM